jgi:YidC/Oxa1 family membrane protein insertase
MAQFIGHFFHIVLIQPLVNLLVLGYRFIPDVGVVIILVTILVRLILAPSFHKSLKSQRKMAVLQPKLNELREKHKDNKEAQAKAMMDLYREHKINPAGSCLPLLIQLPLLIALYQVFRIALGTATVGPYLYSFVHDPGTMNPYFLHIVNLAKPSIALGIIAGISQYFQSRMMLPKEPNTDPTQKMLATQTLYIFPILSIFISLRLPAGLPLYWITTTLFAVVQQYYIIKNHPPQS